MRRVLSTLLLILLGAAPAAAQIPAEWQAAAQAVIGELERDQPQAAAKPWGPELSQGWQLARAWRKHNNGNVEIILAEYLMFVALCRRGCANSTVEGQNYIAVAEQVKGLRNQNAGPYALAANAHAWLAALPDPTGAAKKNAAMWEKDPDVAAADFATGNIYALAWLLARNRPTPQEQASAFAGFALFVQGKAWIGERCLDISKVATVLGAPPRIDMCK
jgi:hypothetical protein